MADSILEIDDNTLAVKCPEDTTWVDVLDNFLGIKIQDTLGITSQCFLRYGPRENAVYYNPNTFYLPKGNWKFDKIENSFIILKRDNGI